MPDPANQTLKIKPAAEYAARASQIEGEMVKPSLRQLAIKYINDVITPRIEDMLARPAEYMGHDPYAYTFTVVYRPTEDFVRELTTLLTPLGFRVKHSTDGGGLYGSVDIGWKP